MPYTDQQLSDITGVSPRSLRRLATLGVVKPIHDHRCKPRSWPDDAVEKIVPVAVFMSYGVATEKAVELVRAGFRRTHPKIDQINYAHELADDRRLSWAATA